MRELNGYFLALKETTIMAILNKFVHECTGEEVTISEIWTERDTRLLVFQIDSVIDTGLVLEGRSITLDASEFFVVDLDYCKFLTACTIEGRFGLNAVIFNCGYKRGDWESELYFKMHQAQKIDGVHNPREAREWFYSKIRNDQGYLWEIGTYNHPYVKRQYNHMLENLAGMVAREKNKAA